MSFCTIILSQSIKIMQNYVTWIQISLSSTKDVSKYIAYDAKKTFDTSIYEIEKPPSGLKERFG